MKRMSIVLIVMGIMVMFYPKIHSAYTSYRQEKILEDWKESMDAIGTDDLEEIEEERISPPKIKKNQVAAYTQGAVIPEIEGRDPKGKVTRPKEETRPILIIDKIDLELPVLEDATKKNLDISTSHIKGTADPGRIGNYAIAGHRSRAYGRFFNRLDEMEIGDTIKIKIYNTIYTYTVFKKFVVKPEEVWVLESNQRDRIITLTTCHPFGQSTHRLIVQGRIE